MYQPKSTLFVGNIVGLKAHIPRQAEIYVKTTKEVLDYVVKTMKRSGSDVKNSIKDLNLLLSRGCQTVIWNSYSYYMYLNLVH